MLLMLPLETQQQLDSNWPLLTIVYKYKMKMYYIFWLTRNKKKKQDSRGNQTNEK